MRRGLLTLGILGLLACDTMISDRVLIKTPADAANAQRDALVAVRATLASHGFKESSRASAGELWVWHDEAHPPDIHATVSESWNQVGVHLEQGLYGPIGPTETYRAVKSALVEDARRRYGKASVHVE